PPPGRGTHQKKNRHPRPQQGWSVYPFCAGLSAQKDSSDSPAVAIKGRRRYMCLYIVPLFEIKSCHIE
ncbi:hypothetical protein, partial [Marinirhabdus gelatinilytica]|uniref:hypothetical protein n=1 Tax=Marinirhabdus gelatinilytica TaxID=1703343 RepID=UPI001B8771F6